MEHKLNPSQCLHISTLPCTTELFKHVESLWQVEVLPFQNVTEFTRSKQDKEAIELLESKTVHVEEEEVKCYATPLLWKRDMPCFHAMIDAVMTSLQSTERKLVRNPQKADLVQSGAFKSLSLEDLNKDGDTCLFFIIWRVIMKIIMWCLIAISSPMALV